MINAEEVARYAGVSRSTVSRVINNYSNVPDETRRSVQKAIEALGYVPHASARLLAGSVNKTIGLYIDNRSNYYDDKISSSSFFAPFTTELIDFTNKLGYNVLVTQYTDQNSFSRFQELFSSKTIVAGIILGARNDDPRVLELVRKGFLLGLVDQDPTALTSANNRAVVANFDNQSGTLQALRHLHKLGHRAIAHIQGNLSIYSGVKRLEGFRLGLQSLGIPFDPGFVADGDFSEEGGLRATKEILSRVRPTAIFAASDESAIGVLRALEELGLRVPEDISVVGFDGIDLLRYMKPSLATVVTNKRELAFKLTKTLVAAVEAELIGTKSFLIGVSFSSGGSTRAL